jgi:hypothetical protein
MPEEVIDVMVAVSHPERFVVSPEQPITEAEPRGDLRGGRRIPVVAGYRGYLAWDPFYYDSFFGYDSWYRYRAAGFGYSPYGYGGYGYGYGGYGYGPTVIRIERARSGGSIVNGRGWRPGSQVDTGRRAQPRDNSSAGSTGSGSSGSGSSASGSPGSSGSQPARTGRTARRRGGGD